MELTKEPGQTQRHVEMCIYIYKWKNCHCTWVKNVAMGTKMIIHTQKIILGNIACISTTHINIPGKHWNVKNLVL